MAGLPRRGHLPAYAPGCVARRVAGDCSRGHLRGVGAGDLISSPCGPCRQLHRPPRRRRDAVARRPRAGGRRAWRPGFGVADSPPALCPSTMPAAFPTSPSLTQRDPIQKSRDIRESHREVAYFRIVLGPRVEARCAPGDPAVEGGFAPPSDTTRTSTVRFAASPRTRLVQTAPARPALEGRPRRDLADHPGSMTRAWTAGGRCDPDGVGGAAGARGSIFLRWR